MKLRHRAMRPGDIPECVEIVANHPVVGPHYGRDIELLSGSGARPFRPLLGCPQSLKLALIHRLRESGGDHA